MSLAWQLMLSRAGMLVMHFVDIVMLGRYSAEAIGAFNLGVSIFVPLMVLTIGLTSGAVPVISRAFGAGDCRLATLLLGLRLLVLTRRMLGG